VNEMLIITPAHGDAYSVMFALLLAFFAFFLRKFCMCVLFLLTISKDFRSCSSLRKGKILHLSDQG